jgi:hypothetical protein
MFVKLPAKVRDFIELDVREYGAAQTLHDYIAAQQAEYFPRLLPKLREDEPQWTQGQCEARATAHLMNGHPLLHRGYSKRILEDAPSELAYSASLYARLRLWWGTRDEYDSFLNFSNDMLRALAAGDVFVIQRFAEVTPPRATTGPRAEKLLHAGITAAVLRDDERLAAAIAEYDTWDKPKAYISCIYTSFRGLLEKDETLVVEGLQSLLKTSKKISQLYDIFKVISLETHGMYELCRWYKPELVAKFDTTQGLPWDQGLSAWVRQNEGARPFYDVTSLSPDLHEWLEKLPIKDGRDHHWPEPTN